MRLWYCSCAALIALLSCVASAIAQPQPVQKPQIPPRAGMVMVRTEQAFPSGERAGSSVLLERSHPRDVRPGDVFSYELKITNISRATINNVMVVETSADGFKVDSVTPKPDSDAGGKLTWRVAKLTPNESKAVTVTGSTAGRADLNWCATVTFETVLCAMTKVVEPVLTLVKTTPPEVLLCDPIPVRLVVSNTGNGAARMVRVMDTLPDGWETTGARKELMFDVGELPAGASREFTFTARAARTGTFANNASAEEVGGVKVQASSTTVVRQPVLVLSKTCPETRFVGRTGEFVLTLQNTGDTAAKDVIVSDDLPAGLEFISADQGGRLAGSRVTWAIGTLQPGATVTMKMQVKAARIGEAINVATARAICAEARAQCTMKTPGIPAILLEVIDLSDPIEIGANETYEIFVTNQGSMQDTNVTIVCELPAEEEFVNAGGATQATASGRIVRFAPLPSLAPKARAKWSVVVKGTRVGDVRFRTSLTSDVTTTPVEETESTHIYD